MKVRLRQAAARKTYDDAMAAAGKSYDDAMAAAGKSYDDAMAKESETMDTLEVLALARRKFPKHRFGRDHEGETIGVYNENLGRFQVCLYRGTDGLWYAAGKEILFGGQPVPRTWYETEQPATV